MRGNFPSFMSLHDQWTKDKKNSDDAKCLVVKSKKIQQNENKHKTRDKTTVVFQKLNRYYL